MLCVFDWLKKGPAMRITCFLWSRIYYPSDTPRCAFSDHGLTRTSQTSPRRPATGPLYPLQDCSSVDR